MAHHVPHILVGQVTFLSRVLIFHMLISVNNNSTKKWMDLWIYSRIHESPMDSNAVRKKKVDAGTDYK